MQPIFHFWSAGVASRVLEYKWYGLLGFFAMVELSPMDDLWKALSNIGVAGFMFFFYRADRKDSEAKYLAIATDHQELIVANTKALTELTVLLRQGK